MATYIELKADDVMPWGKYIGISLRAIYKLDADYFQYLCSRTKEYSISSKTKKLDDHTSKGCGRCSNCLGKHFFE